MALGSDTYLLLHKMLEASETEEDLELARKSFQLVVDENSGSTNRDDRFDVAWSMSCLASIYVRLEQITLAEQAYLTAIRLFDENDMALQSAGHSMTLAKLYVGLGRLDDAESQMKAYVGFETKGWGDGSEEAMGVEEVLVHFQKTGEVIQAFEHSWCESCGVNEYGIGSDE